MVKVALVGSSALQPTAYSKVSKASLRVARDMVASIAIVNGNGARRQPRFRGELIRAGTVVLPLLAEPASRRQVDGKEVSPPLWEKVRSVCSESERSYSSFRAGPGREHSSPNSSECLEQQREQE